MIHLDADLAALRQRLLLMASHAANQVRQAMKAFTDRDDDLVARVEEADNILDDFEIEIDELALQLLLGAPLARDLRLILVATKIGHALERVGDEATAIARRARALNREPQLRSPGDLAAMAHLVLNLLDAALAAFVAGDADQARAVIPRDREVDHLNRQLHREFTTLLTQTPANVTRCLGLMAIAKRLERIGDHAKNIAEEVVYLSEARDIRHTRKPPDAPGAPASP